MNYRHAFHAGNFADVFKHAILARILTRLREKPAPFRVIDTHAGEGLYDLAGEAANRTGEWRDGIGRLAEAILPGPSAELLEPYLAAVRACNREEGLRFYPGSPLIARYLLRDQDRLIACEVVPEAAAALALHLRAAATAPGAVGPHPRPRDRISQRGYKVLSMDGWLALSAYVPVKERRGLVIVDPPYERPDDFIRLGDGVVAAHFKWPSGIYLMWYPVKDRDGPDRLGTILRRAAIPKLLRIEVTVAPQPLGLGACGIIVINPPWKLAADLDVVLPALLGILERAPGSAITWLDRGPE
jgi:23S rRNA (adenine2030-N6)-methyltransferase